ncbi:hypothetical protein B0H17DRAFT_1131089 [Mycena rosella]|uniref:DUF6589 domain-containing protein n=1 Tax=Mycena rosella TaxID=1033263 RepID=A0AAD7DP09_MYCRO|nr:hypothetical protein B0H17DRAFT_1131089 [Mycena rosella]
MTRSGPKRKVHPQITNVIEQKIFSTLPLEMKPLQEHMLPVLDWSPEDVLPSLKSAAQLSGNCFWQLKCLVLEFLPGVLDALRKRLEECPVVNQIPLHQTEQYPMPAMKLDESTLDDTIEVMETIVRIVMEINDKQLKAHGLMVGDGDLLTHALKDKLESARRNSTTPIAGMQASLGRWGLFHSQMAGGQLTINEHWSTPNLLWPGGLWWEHNKLLERKPMAAGWGGKKATEWKPAHELIHILLPAHIFDGFRSYCRHENLEEWAKTTTYSEFEAVAKTVSDELFSTAALDKIRAHPVQNITLENTILSNHDTLFYVKFGPAIKKGDIGRVLNVLGIWMVMMHSPKTMPRYADATFERLVKPKSFPPKLQ